MARWRHSARWQFSLATLMTAITIMGMGCALGTAGAELWVFAAALFLLAVVLSLILGVVFFVVLYALNIAVWFMDRAGDRFQ